MKKQTNTSDIDFTCLLVGLSIVVLSLQTTTLQRMIIGWSLLLGGFISMVMGAIKEKLGRKKMNKEKLQTLGLLLIIIGIIMFVGFTVNEKQNARNEQCKEVGYSYHDRVAKFNDGYAINCCIDSLTNFGEIIKNCVFIPEKQ